MSSRRVYRKDVSSARLISFTVKIKETDLWLAVSSSAFDPELPALVEHLVWQQRHLLEAYIAQYPSFLESLEPCLIMPDAPPIVKKMTGAANKAGVGPMASVAGTLAEMIGIALLECSQEVIVENGGDVFMRVNEPVKVGIYAGKSPLSNKLALLIDPAKTPLGVCTSSGTVGPSLSFGCADAAVVLSPSTPLADAAATAMGNLVKSPDDIKNALEYARNLNDITGALLICGEKMAAWGDIDLKEA